ncbi:MAG: type 4a pilus biogenesis protein PilO [Patescibacteria group bacterium]
MSRFLIPFLLIAIAAGLFFGFTQPLMDEIAFIKTDNASFEQVLSSASELATVRDGLLKQYNAIDPNDRARLDKAIPDQVDNVRLIIDVDTIAGRYGMSLRDAEVGNESALKDNAPIGPDGKRYSSVTLAFGVRGSYQNLKRFLADLDRSLRVVDIVDLKFKAGDKDQNDYAIKLRTYWRKS